MEFKNISLNEMNRIEQLTTNGVEIYENTEGAIIINHNPEIDIFGFYGAYLDAKYEVLKDWNYLMPTSDDYEIIKLTFREEDLWVGKNLTN